MRGTGHVACIGKRNIHTGFWSGNLKERDYLEDPSVNWEIILKWILKETG
jgi:hypothetical protein